MTETERWTDGYRVERALEGDREAYSSLVERYQNLVYGLAYHWLGSFEDAQDATQETFIVAYRRLSSLQDSSGFRAWLRAIALNQCRMRLRSRRNMSPLSMDLPGDDRQADVDRTLDVRRALALLSEDSRLTVTLYYFQGLSQREVAAFLGVPETTVMSRLRDAKSRLRKELMHMAEQTIRTHSLPDDFASRIPVPYDEFDGSEATSTPIAPLSRWRADWLLSAYPEGTTIRGARTEGYDWQREPDRPVRLTVQPIGAAPEEVVLRTNVRRGGIELEAALLPVLTSLGLPVPRLVAGPADDPELEGRGPIIAVTAPRGRSAIAWCLERDIQAVSKACEVVLEAMDRTASVTDGVLRSPAGPQIERCSLREELSRTVRIGGPWMHDERFLEAVRKLEPVVDTIDEALVFSDSGIGPNARVDDAGEFVEFETFAWARIEDPLYAATKYWTYDCWPLRWAGFVERFLVRHGRTVRDLAPRLGVRALVTLQREIPVLDGDAGYRNEMLGWLRMAIQNL